MRADAGLSEYVDLVPARQQVDTARNSTTAEAVYQNLNLLHRTAPEYALIFAGDPICKMDYARMLEAHAECGVDIMVVCIEYSLLDANGFGVMMIDQKGRVTDFVEKSAHQSATPKRPDHALASMGIFVFHTDFLREELKRDASDSGSRHDFGDDIIARLVRSHHVQAHHFAESCVNLLGNHPYWRDVGTVDAFWDATKDLNYVVPDLNRYDDDWPIRSMQSRLPPAKFVLADVEGRRSEMVDSLVSAG